MYTLKYAYKMQNDNSVVRTEIHLSQVQVGMTVEYQEELYTVGDWYVKHCPLFGYSFRGDGSKQTITRVQFKVNTLKGEIIRY